MRTKQAGARAIFRNVDRSSEHSTLFHWLVEHHDEMLNRSDGGRLRWSTLRLTFAEHGLTTANGKAPTESTARQTWYRVRRWVVAKRHRAAVMAATGLAPRSLMPSASKQSRTPIETASSLSSPVRVSVEPAPVGSTEPNRLTGKEKIARLRRTLEERSGR